MIESVVEQIVSMLGRLEGAYHRLVIVVAGGGGGKSAALREASRRLGAPLINVNLEISREMLQLTERQRAMKTPRILEKIVDAPGSDIVLLDNLETLFDVSLKQDPLRLLRGISRNKTVGAAWSGAIRNDRLIYATPDHREYREYPVSDLMVVDVDARSGEFGEI